MSLQGTSRFLRLRKLAPWAICLALLAGNGPRATAADTGTVNIEVVDETGQRLPCRVHLNDKTGKPQRGGELPFFRDHFSCPGRASLQLPAGTYSFEIERGPEYGRQSGTLEAVPSEVKTYAIRLRRVADLAAEGWYSGDLHVHRSPEDIELLMRAEDLHVAPVITWWNDRNAWAGRPLPESPLVKFDGNRFYHLMAGEDEREGGALMYFNHHEPLPIAGSSREYPSPVKFVELARQRQGIWIDVEKPFWWDVPVWLAGGQVDSIGLANNHMCRSTMYATEAWGKPRDAKRLPPPLGNGYWTQEIYYHVLNCGLRIPPSAGSASGVLPNPLGYDRVYVHVGESLSYQKWWEGLKTGRSFVTNGPLLVCRADGHLPGHVFSAGGADEIKIAIDFSLTAADAVPAVELIKNGRVEAAVPPPVSGKAGSLAVTFDKSGWFLIRAISGNQRTFRFASTAPYYVEIGASRRRVSKRSARFFLDWVNERAKRVALKLQDPAKLAEVLGYHERAKAFWQGKLSDANAP